MRQRSASGPRSVCKEHLSRRKSLGKSVWFVASLSFKADGRKGYFFIRARIFSTARMRTGCELIAWIVRTIGRPTFPRGIFGQLDHLERASAGLNFRMYGTVR